jgi:hypothetical protein
VGLLILLAVSEAMALTALILDFAGIWRRKAGWRWIATAILLINAVPLAGSYADARGGPYAQNPLHSFELPVILTGFALLVIGAVIHDKQPRRPRRTRRHGE